MKRTLKFPALVRGIAPKSGQERHCLVAGAADFEIREVDILRMPIAFTADRHEFPFPIEYRMLDGVLYKCEDDYDSFEIDLESEDVMAHGGTIIYRKVADEIIDVMKSGTVSVWPKDAYLHRERGAKDIATSGIALLPGGEEDMAFWKDRFKRVLDGLVVTDNRIWTRTAEPVFCVSLLQGVAGQPRMHLTVDDVSIFAEKRTEWGTRQSVTSENGGKYRVFSIREYDAAVKTLHEMAADLGVEAEIFDTIEVVMPDAVSMDIDRLEMDRLARVCTVHAAKQFSKVKPGGGETILEVAPASLVREWLELKDFLLGYNPLEGIADDLEQRFTAFIAEADGFAHVYGPALISPRLRNAVSYSFDRWENRSINVVANTSFLSTG